MGWHVEEMSRNVHTIVFDNIASGWKQTVLLTGDRHHDSIYTDKKLERKHLDTALEIGAPIIDIGDMFDAMQGREDPRRNMDELGDGLAREDYYDALVEQAEAFYLPYAENLTVLGIGNHETAVRKRSGTDLTSRLAHRLRNATGNLWPFRGGYGGYVRLQFRRNNYRKSVSLKYFHGSGGGGPVTKGVIKTNRNAVAYPDADIVAMGHIHEAWAVSIPREKCSQAGRISLQNQWHICVPSYKNEYGDGAGGWHVETGKPPKPIGCAWVTFSYLNDDISMQPWVEVG